MTPSEGASFAQKGKREKKGGRQRKSGDFDEKYWKDKECYNCNEKGHPASHCPKKEEDDDDKSRASSASSVKKLEKDMKNMKKKFSTVNTQLEQLKENDSDPSDSEDEECESHFQMMTNGFQFTQLEEEFEPKIAKSFKQADDRKTIKLDLREVILLDSQSTMDLTCNPTLVKETFKSSSSMKLCSNGGTKSSAAPKNLFKINKDCEKSDGTKAVKFHDPVAKTLHAMK